MATDYGSDVSTITADGILDLDPYFTIITGQTALAHAIAGRLSTPKGQQIDDPEYGFDLVSLINSPLDSTDLIEATQEIESQCLQDERIDDVTVTIDQDDDTLTVSLNVLPVIGQSFDLVLSVSAVSVSVLEGA